MEEVDALRVEVEQILKQEAENPNFRLEKRMEVCQTCGAFLIVGDALKRIESHFEGRQHTGWARVRQTLQEFEAKMSHNRHRRPDNHQQQYHQSHREHGEIGQYNDHRRDYERRDRGDRFERRPVDYSGYERRRDRSPPRRRY